MKVLIVSGFLGSGKTTFINQLMKIRPDEYMILENEYASENIDAELLENDREKIWEMTEGCVCCSMNKDMAETVLTISNSYNPNVLVIEPTGIGKLSQIIKRVSKVCYEKIELLPAITLVDATVFLKNYKESDPNYIDQILYAKTILLTKTDNSKREEKLGILKKIKELNPKATCLIAEDIKDDPLFWDNIITDEFKTSDIDLDMVSEENSEFSNIALSGIKEESIENFLAKINLLLRGVFGEILRIKGFLQINEQWTKIDSVGLNYKLETIEAKEKSKFVIIGKDLKKNYLIDMFRHNKMP